MTTTERSLRIDSLSFYWRMNPSPGENGGLPETLPFAFAFEPATQLVIQERNPLVLDRLHDAYLEDANVGYLQEGHSLAASYGRDVLDFILGTLDKRTPAETRVTEIGCGGGYLLSELRSRGYQVQGIDPSPVAVRRAAELGIDLVPSFYPAAGIKPSDLIFHYDVLEHVEEPVEFLRHHRDHLKPGGTILIAVPDCTDSIGFGDISMAIHEHLNYFDCDSLGRTVEAAGFQVLNIQKSRYGGVLFCAATWGAVPPGGHSSSDGAKFDDFRNRAARVHDDFRSYSKSVGDLGVYVPLRAIPYLCRDRRFDGVRFFDDDPGTHGKFFSAFPAPIESFTQFCANPPQNVVVASLVFANAIIERIHEKAGNGIDAVPLRKFMNGTAASRCRCGGHA